MKFLVFLALAICATTATLSSELLEARWANYKATQNKRYINGREEVFRKKIFEANVAKIDAHNERFKQGLETYTKGENLFTDMTPEEIRPYTHGLIEPKNSPKPLIEVTSRKDLGIPEDWRAPDSYDWRDQGVVTAVKNQGGCGSCWAFSSTGAMESQERIRRGADLDISLSEQQLVDCVPDNLGCSGGWPTNAFTYVVGNGGLDSEGSYPYEGVDGSCRYDAGAVASRLKGYVYLTSPDEEAMKDLMVNNGPISVCFDADGDFGSYSGGVYYNPTCENDKFTHAVVAVGYGNENGEDYWLVKNSWGPGWGLEGYFKIARNRDNHCGIASKAAVPLLED